MEIVYDEPNLSRYIANATEITPDHPVLIDRFLEDAVEIDVDALFDGKDMYLGGIMEHIEEAGIHSGDSACVLPPITLGGNVLERVRTATRAIAEGVGVRGLINIQFALASDVLYVLEANPRASRTVPFVSKALGVPLVDHACRLLLGEPLAALELPKRVVPERAWAKEAVFPSDRFAGAADRGVEMRSTGEVMASGTTVVDAYRRALRAAGGARAAGAPGPSLQAA
jgi:carbamoyl-phosphate synthase large subunit